MSYIKLVSTWSSTVDISLSIRLLVLVLLLRACLQMQLQGSSTAANIGTWTAN